MNDSLKEKLIKNLPTKLTIYGSVDYPEFGHARINGVCPKCGWIVDWFYDENPNIIHLKTLCLDQSGIDEDIPIEELKTYLS
jgi:hypothetical protein